MKIITVANQKGGVGKTTTCQALLEGLNENKVLGIDLDPQKNFTANFLPNAELEKNIYKVFRGEESIRNCIKTISENVDIVPSSILMAGIDLEIQRPGKEYILKEALEQIKNNYEYIIIDTPPVLGTIVANALTVADELIIPMETQAYSLQGLTQLLNTVKIIKKYYNQNLQISGILITKFEKNTNLAKKIEVAIREYGRGCNINIFNQTIRKSVSIGKCQLEQSKILDKNSKVKDDYLKVISELTIMQK